MGVPGCLDLGGNYARFGYRPLDALGFIPFGEAVEGSPADIDNNELVHEGIVFVDGSIKGYFNSTGTITGVGVVKNDSKYSVFDYTFRGPLYDGNLLWDAIINVTKTWQGSGYNLLNHNCQDFNDAVREEYFNLGGKIISTDCIDD